MEMVLEDIKCIPGVSCVFCFDTRAGIVAKIAAPKFSDETLRAVGRTLVKIFSGGKQLFPDMQSAQVRLDQLNVFIIWVTGTHYLAILHEQNLNPTLLSMTLIQTIKELKTSLAVPVPMMPNAPDAGRMNIRDTLGTGPHLQILNAMETSLAKVMGPMASIVFQDTLEQWIESIDDPRRIPMEKLVKMLSAEINDPEKIKTYELLIAPHLRAQ
jgi:hypothetical protein